MEYLKPVYIVCFVGEEVEVLTFGADLEVVIPNDAVAVAHYVRRDSREGCKVLCGIMPGVIHRPVDSNTECHERSGRLDRPRWHDLALSSCLILLPVLARQLACFESILFTHTAE